MKIRRQNRSANKTQTPAHLRRRNTSPKPLRHQSAESRRTNTRKKSSLKSLKTLEPLETSQTAQTARTSQIAQIAQTAQNAQTLPEHKQPEQLELETARKRLHAPRIAPIQHSHVKVVRVVRVVKVVKVLTTFDYISLKINLCSQNRIHPQTQPLTLTP